jgi:hypothetical protein
MTGSRILALAACALAACASGSRTNLTTSARLLHGADPAFAKVALSLADEKLLGTNKDGAVQIVAVPSEGGCVDTFTRQRTVRFCPLITNAAAGEAQLFHALGEAGSFSVRIDQGRIWMESDGARAEVPLPDGAEGTLARRPELAAALFAENYLPGGLSRLGPLPLNGAPPPNAGDRRVAQ